MSEKLMRVKMDKVFPYSPDGVKTVRLAVGEVKDVPEEFGKIIVADGYGKKSQAKTAAEVKAAADQDAADVRADEVDEAESDALDELAKEHEDAMKILQDSHDAVAAKLKTMSGEYTDLMKLAQAYVPPEKLKDADKSTWERLGASFAKLFGN